MTKKTTHIIGWVLTILIAFIFIASASMKLIGGPDAIKAAESMGLTGGTIKLLGVMEIISILLFIFPRTGITGTLLLAAYLGGAIATHLVQAQPFFAPLIIQCILWITAIIRFPELGRRLRGIEARPGSM